MAETEQSTTRAAQIESAILSREIANKSKENIKSILDAKSLPAHAASSLQLALQLKELAEYFDKSALELEQFLVKTDPENNEISVA